VLQTISVTKHFLLKKDILPSQCLILIYKHIVIYYDKLFSLATVYKL